jgi:ESCRT-I complex subunit TSG101
MSSVTQTWLRQNITAYTHPDPVFSHIVSLLLLFPTIRPKSDVYSAWHDHHATAVDR